MIEDDHDIIDIEEVVREMNQEPPEVQPEAVSSFGRTRTFCDICNFATIFTLLILVNWVK